MKPMKGNAQQKSLKETSIAIQSFCDNQIGHILVGYSMRALSILEVKLMDMIK